MLGPQLFFRDALEGVRASSRQKDVKRSYQAHGSLPLRIDETHGPLWALVPSQIYLGAAISQGEIVFAGTFTCIVCWRHIHGSQSYGDEFPTNSACWKLPRLAKSPPAEANLRCGWPGHCGPGFLRAAQLGGEFCGILILRSAKVFRDGPCA